MNKAHFEVLGLTVPSGIYTFHDDGYVSSISDATMQVNRQYGHNNSGYDKNSDRNVIGRECVRGSDIHIFYLKQPTLGADVRLRAHEETHALEDIGQLDSLTERLSEEQNVKINLRDIDEVEVRAELGALYALNSRGISPWKLWLIYDDENWPVAKKLYKQAKQSQRRFFVF